MRQELKYSHVVPNYRPHTLFIPYTYAPKANFPGNSSQMATIAATNNNITLTFRAGIPTGFTKANQRSFGENGKNNKRDAPHGKVKAGVAFREDGSLEPI